jgi:hypothetical protein
MADDGWDGSNRHDSSGQYAIAHQRIQDGGFAALELTDASNVEASLRCPFCHRPRVGGNLFGVKLLSQFGQAQEC